jgi:long-chain acyl-CoA synthetase
VGKPIPGVELRIRNPDESGVGEVLIKGPNVMQGYFRQPDLTAQVKSEDNWFNSQDLGYLDKQGYLFLTGRKKDVIVLSSGKNIYPEELEEYYMQSPYIKEICVFQKTQQQFGQEIGVLFAVIVPDFQYFLKTRGINIRGKIRWELENLSAKLPTYKRVMGFVISKEELPRTRLKKIKRYEVSAKYLGQIPQEEAEKPPIAPQDKDILDSEMAQKIIKYLSQQLNKRVDLDSHLEIDLGIDSLSRVELGLGLESLLLIRLPQELINSVLTVKELIINFQQLKHRAKETRPTQAGGGEKTWEEILGSTPPQEVLRKIKLSFGFFDWVLNCIFNNLLKFVFRLLWGLEIRGREFIPSQGPFVFCPNHASYLDGFVLFASVPLSCAINLFFIGHAAIFEHPLVRWAIKIARLISIDPITHLTQALQASGFVLKGKKMICIFPEGSRSIDSNVQEFKKGVGILAKELNIPLIPVYIKGSHFAWPRTKRFPQIHRLRIIFGKPVYWQDLGSDYASITKGLRQAVLELGKLP